MKRILTLYVEDDGSGDGDSTSKEVRLIHPTGHFSNGECWGHTFEEALGKLGALIDEAGPGGEVRL